MAKPPDEKPKKQKKMTAKEQSERFIQTARELDVEESGVAFDKAFEALVSGKKSKIDTVPS